MRIPLPLLLNAASVMLAFGVGIWVSPMIRGNAAGEVSGSGRNSRLAKTDTPHSESGAVSNPSEQAKADALLAAASPRVFLDSLRSSGGLEAKARLLAAVAEMPLGAIRSIASDIEKHGLGRGRRAWEFQGAMVEKWADLDPEGLLETIQSDGNVFLVQTGLPSVFGRLAERDPEAAWERARELNSGRFQAIDAVLATIGESNPEKALGMARTLESKGEGASAITGFMGGWLAKDPEAALKAFANLPKDEWRAALTENVAYTLAAIDSDRALTFSRSLADPGERETFAKFAANTIARKDPLRALAMLEDPTLSRHRRSLLQGALGNLARRDFDAALAYAMDLKSPADHRMGLLSLTTSATKDQRARLLEVAHTLPPSISKDIYQQSVYGGLWGPGADADAFLSQIKSPGLKEDLLKSSLESNQMASPEELKDLFGRLQPSSQSPRQTALIAYRLATQDPAGALEWAKQLESADLRNAALKSALKTWSATNPEAAARSAAGIEDATNRAESLRSIAQSWARSDESGALGWAQSLAGPDRTAALGALIQSTLEGDPTKAREMYTLFAADLDGESANRQDTKEVTRSVATTLTENNPRQAVDWALALPTGGSQNEAFASIAEKWSAYDPVATSEWIGSLPAGEGRDLASSKLVSSIARDDPDAAWAWATSITSVPQRREAAGMVLKAWKGHGRRSDALAALEAAGFSPDDTLELARALD